MTEILEREDEAVVAVAKPASDPSRGGGWRAQVLPPLALGVLLVLVWYLVWALLDPTQRFLLPAPHEVITEGLLEDGIWRDQLGSLWQTAIIAAAGLTISIVLGFTLAIIMSQSSILENAVFPYAVVVQAVPILALVPLIQFWFGTASTARIIVCIIISLFPIILNTLFGLQSADQGLHDLFTLHQVSRWTRLRKLMFPSALPAIFAGLRISAGLSVIGAVVGDFFFGAGTTGIGQDLKKYANTLKGPELFAAAGLACGLGIAVFLFFGWLRNTTISKWHDTANIS